MEFVFLPFIEERENVGSIVPRSVNDPITTLLFFGGVQKYYDGPVALYIYFVCDSAIPKFLFFSNIKNKEKKNLLFLFSYSLIT